MLLNLILFLILNKNIKSVIVLPIFTLPNDNYKNSNNNNNIFEQTINSLYKSYFYTIIQLGHPLQTIPLLIKPEQNLFIITSINSIKNCTSYQYKDTFNLSNSFFINNNFTYYNEKKSDSFILNQCDYGKFYEAEEICDCNETFLFYTDISLKQYIKQEILLFNLARNVEDNITGEIGLNLYDKNKRSFNSFLSILKRYKLINNYNWCFDVNKNNTNDIKLIIGALPHEIEPEIYSINDLMYTKVDMNNFLIYWRMKFNVIFARNSDLFASLKYFDDTSAEFKFDIDIIIGTDEYKNYLFKILEDLFKKQKCFNSSINDYKNHKDKLKFIYCKNDKYVLNELNDSLLPIIFFHSVDLNYTFEIDNDDLLFIKDEYIYIKILFSEKGNNIWKFGKPFSLKYKFIFNPETKQIGFYIKQSIPIRNITKKEKVIISSKDNNNKNILIFQIFFIVILIILLTYLILKCYKIFCNLKRHKSKKEILLFNDNKKFSESNEKEMVSLNEGNNSIINEK